MAVSVLTRPISFRQGTEVTATGSVSNNGSGVALFTKTTHTLVVGGFIYIKSPVENYNGYHEVSTTPTANTFTIKKPGESSDVAWIKNLSSATWTYFPNQGSQKWHCIHLPIAYSLSSTLWPTNSADTARGITGVTDSNGYCAVVADGDIKASGSASALEFVKITGCDDTELNGVYQIISYTNETTFTIDLPYSSATDTDLTDNASIQYYYQNYHVKVEVWGGLNNGHTYYAQEPYELLGTLDLVPDENNEVKFSIHEILKENVKIANNLLLGTLPNNLDAWTGFFIKYAEVYDDSDGTTLAQITPSFTSDLSTFEGYAVNAVLPFKGIHSGALSLYSENTNARLFLTGFRRPTVFSGQYFDISFINNFTSGVSLELREQYYLNGSLQDTVTTTIPTFGEGVYRFPLSDPDCDYDRVDVKINDIAIETLTIDINCDCVKSQATGYNLSWLNHLGGFDYWYFSGYADDLIDVEETGETEENTFPQWPNSYGEFADTIRKQTHRNSRRQVVVRSQHLTEAQVDAIKSIRTSPLVQIVNSIYDRRTVIVDADSFTSKREEDKLHTITFTITYTDDVPSQRV